ncbi:MAG TPA: transferrin-binding protein-like solute binding protein [Sphingomicrobium sp.]
MQTTMVYDDKSARPDAQVNASGGSASIQGGALTIDVAAFQNADVKFLSSDYANLDWTRVGYWSTGGGWWDADDVVGRSGVFVTGYETPAAAVPTTGSATYAGAVQGTVLYPGTSAGTTHCNCVVETLAGNASFTANFGTRNVSGSLTSMTAGGVPWNSVAFNSTITGNSFSGTTSVTTTPAGPASLAPNATGTVEGRFFGPSAQEAGAVWTLFDGVKAAIGTLTGKGP